MSAPRSFLRHDENTDAMSRNETMLRRLSSRVTKLISYFQYCKNRRIFSEGPRCAGWWGCAHGITGPQGVKRFYGPLSPVLQEVAQRVVQKRDDHEIRDPVQVGGAESDHAHGHGKRKLRGRLQ